MSGMSPLGAMPALAIALAMPCGQVLAADAPRFSHEAALIVERPAAFVELELPLAVLAASKRGDLADLRLEDAQGRPLPFAWLPPRRSAAEPRERLAAATLYAWPRAAQPDALPESVKVVTRGARIEVRSGPLRGGVPLAGWLIDLGERDKDDPRPSAIQLDWPASAVPFTAAYGLSSSDDLRHWRNAGGGHLLALAAPAGGAPLTQSRMPLPADAGRFVRLSWLDATGVAPTLSAAHGVQPQPAAPAEDPPLRLELKPVPASQAASGAGKGNDAAESARAARSVVVDLGAVLELRRLSISLVGGSRVVPLAVQWRQASDQAWSPAAQTVAYRLERPGGAVDVPPALELAGRARQLRLVPDERAGSLIDAVAGVVVEAGQPRLVFVAQGPPPYRLRIGDAQAAGAALAVAQLVPGLEQERGRLGRAVAGALQADVQAQAAEASQRQWARWRPVALWAVLIGGVAGLGAMVWRLARGR